MARGGREEVLDDLGAILERTWSGLGAILGRLGRALAVLRRSWGGLGAILARLGRSRSAQEAIEAYLGRLWEVNM